MGNITNIVEEGLKYPFKDFKKYLSFGVLHVLMIAFFLGGLISIFHYSFSFWGFNQTVNASSSITPSPTMLAIGVILFILAFIVNLFISGYNFKIIKYSIAKNSEVPDFSDYVQILGDGLKVVIVQIAYAILPTILFLLGFMLAINNNVGGFVNIIGSLILAIDIILAVVVAFVQIMAIAYMADKGRLSSAFEFKNISALISRMGPGQYVGALLFLAIALVIIYLAASIVLQIIGFIVMLIIPIILVAPFLVMILRSLLINSFMNISSSRVFGSIYNLATDNWENENNNAKSNTSENNSYYSSSR